jgi:hypothetical protein
MVVVSSSVLIFDLFDDVLFPRVMACKLACSTSNRSVKTKTKDDGFGFRLVFVVLMARAQSKHHNDRHGWRLDARLDAVVHYFRKHIYSHSSAELRTHSIIHHNLSLQLIASRTSTSNLGQLLGLTARATSS